MVLYASDLDRTLIFSTNFLAEYPTSREYTPVEYKEERVISYMSTEVLEELAIIDKEDSNIIFTPVTTRSIDEYNRINIGIKPKYAITSNGGTILKNGIPMENWNSYIKNKFRAVEAFQIINIIENEMESIGDYQVKIIDQCYLFFKTTSPKMFDEEVMYLMAMFPKWEFTRQRNKCYAIPKHFSKQIALRWLWHELNTPYIVASGDSELDLSMLTLANKAIIPEHSVLLKEGYITEATTVSGGIESPLETIKIVKDISKLQ